MQQNFAGSQANIPLEQKIILAFRKNICC